MSQPRLAVILVNWQGAEDTIECLESLLRSTIPVHAIVCDNDSRDGSVEAIIAWAEGRRMSRVKNPALSRLSTPPITKPLDYRHIKPNEKIPDAGPDTLLTILETGDNLGYAGGNNVGLRFALRAPTTDFFWLLNNDTVVDPTAAAAIVSSLVARSELGMLGTDVRFYYDPDRLQLQCGQRFNRWTGRGLGITAGKLIRERIDTREVERQVDFVCGASLAVSRNFLVNIGLMEECYFLYFEEIDWAMRNRNRFTIGYNPEAIVYHKEGASAGSSAKIGERSPFSEYHLARSKLIFARIHMPLFVPIYMSHCILVAVKRFFMRQPSKSRAILRGAFGLSFSPIK